MKYTFNDFRMGIVAVKTGLGKDFHTFMKRLQKRGFYWISCDKPLDYTPPFHTYGDDTIIACDEPTGRIYFQRVEYARSHGLIVVSIKDIVDAHCPAHQIVIDFNDNITTARMLVDGEVVKETTAKCAPCDKFNFHTGAEVAFNRLWEKKEKEEKEEKEEKTDSAPFKIGDSVRYTSDNVFSGPKRGATGKVIAYSSNFIGVCLVEFDEPVKGGHNGVAIICAKDGKHGRNGYCWWCPNCFIERI